jgi:hypothetical protein
MTALIDAYILWSATHLLQIARVAIAGACCVVPLVVIFFAWALCRVGAESDVRIPK